MGEWPVAGPVRETNRPKAVTKPGYQWFLWAEGCMNMAENTQPQQGDSRQVQLRIDESKMNTTYANTIRTSTTQDEVVLDFGMNLPMAGL